MVYFIALVIYFILCQIIVSRYSRIKVLLQVKSSSKILFYAICVIALGMLLSIIFKWSWLVIGAITVFECSIVFEKYRLVFEDMEKGKKFKTFAPQEHQKMLPKQLGYDIGFHITSSCFKKHFCIY